MARPRVPAPRFDFRGGVNTTFSADVLDNTELRRAQNARPVQGGYQTVLGSRRIHDAAMGPPVSVFSDGQFFTDGGAWSDGTLDGGSPVTAVRQWDAPAGRQVVAIANGQLFTWAEGDIDFTAGPTGLSTTTRARFATYRTGASIQLLIADGKLWTWDGTTLTDLTTTVGAPAALDVALYKLRAFAIAGTKTLYWSKIGDVTKWAPVDGGGNADVETFDTEPLTGLIVVGGSLLLPKAQNIARFTGTDSATINIDTGTEGVSNMVGCIARHTLQELGGGAVMLSAIGPIYATESGVQELGLKVSKEFDFANRGAWSDAIAQVYETRHEVWWWLPSAGLATNSVAWINNWQQDNWTGPVTGKDASSACAFESIDGTETFLRGGYDGWVRREQIEASAADDVLRDGTGGASVQMAIELPPLLFGDPSLMKSLRGRQTLEADLGASGSLEVSWASELGSGTVTIASKGAGVRDYAYRLGAKGRRIVVTFSSAGTIVTLNGVTPMALLGAALKPRGQ